MNSEFKSIWENQFIFNVILPIMTDRQYLRRVDIAGHEVHTPVSGSNRSTELKHEAPSYPPQQ